MKEAGSPGSMVFDDFSPVQVAVDEFEVGSAGDEFAVVQQVGLDEFPLHQVGSDGFTSTDG